MSVSKTGAVNNFGQSISQKPYVLTQVTSHTKVTAEGPGSDPYVIFTIRTESNLPEYKSEKKTEKGDSSWYGFSPPFGLFSGFMNPLC